MYQNLLKRTTIYCLVFFIIAMAGMVYFDANKIIVIADSSTVSTNGEHGDNSGVKTQYQLLLKNTDGNKKQFVIPLENTVMAEDVQIQNHYIDNELWIGIRGANSEFYSREYVSGNLENVVSGGYDIVDDVVWIKLAMKDTYEFESTMSNGKLMVKTANPREIYDKIVVIDAGHGGTDMGSIAGRFTEKKIALDVLLAVQEELKDSDIKVYYTRSDDGDVDDEKRVALANSVQADMLISIHLSYDEDLTVNGVTAVYNGDYFIQDFNSIYLADKLEQAVAGETGAFAIGLKEAEEADLLVKKAKVPAAQINIGYLSNEEERKLLVEKEYQELIAQGICDAITEIFKEMSKK